MAEREPIDPWPEPLIVAARRTAVAPRGGAFARLEPHDLAAPCLAAVLADVGMSPERVDDVLLGNALGAGGNPARMAALAVGLPDRIPALSVESQCCAGLDAVLLAAAKVRAGEAEAIIAGGVESFSRSPIRMTRPRAKGEAPVAYDRPPFAPDPARDPEMADAAARLAVARGITRTAQASWAIAGHAKARAAGPSPAILPLAGLGEDAFTRKLTPALCARLPVLAGDAVHGLTAATIAVEADAAACVLVVSPERARTLGVAKALRIRAHVRRGGDPAMPPLAPIEAAREALARAGLTVADLAAVEIMEAFAVQAMAFVADLAIPEAKVNRHGGALARGHPIAASGAILLADLFHRLAPGETALLAIAAAGGLATAVVVEAAVP
mgnify:CR=1 FL=1